MKDEGKGTVGVREQRRWGGRYGLGVLALLVVVCGLQARSLPDQKPLAGILKGSAAYCARLKARVFHFCCEEKVVEEVEKALFYPERKTGMKNFFEKVERRGDASPGTVGMGRKMDRVYAEIDAGRRTRAYRTFRKAGRISCLSDYQIIQDGRGLREQRIPLKINGKRVPRNTPPPATALYSYANALVPVMLFAAEVQPFNTYVLLGEERVAGRPCTVVKVARLAPEGAVDLARAWIDKKDNSIVRCEVFPPAIDGYDALLNLDRDQMSHLEISDIHEYGRLQQGLRYPTRTEITVSYNNEPKKVLQSAANEKPRMGGLVSTRVRTVITHRKYRFFQVGVGEPVFQNLGED